MMGNQMGQMMDQSGQMNPMMQQQMMQQQMMQQQMMQQQMMQQQMMQQQMLQQQMAQANAQNMQQQMQNILNGNQGATNAASAASPSTAQAGPSSSPSAPAGQGICVIFRAGGGPGGQGGQQGAPIMIQCMPDDKVASVINKYRIKTNDTDNTKKFIFNAKNLNASLSVAEAGLTNNANIFVVTTQGVKGAH